MAIDFSIQNYDYFRNIGILSFYGSEFYGISNRKLEGIPGSNAILLALSDRKEFNLPEEWLPIYFCDDGYMCYLDYSHLNKEGEPRVIMALYTVNKYEIVKVIAEDLGDFLLEKVKQQLAKK